MNASVAIADPIYDMPPANRLAPQTLTVLHEQASGPHGQRIGLTGSGLAIRACHARYARRTINLIDTMTSNGKNEVGGKSTRRYACPYGRIFFVTLSKPVQRKRADDNPVATPEVEVV